MSEGALPSKKQKKTKKLNNSIRNGRRIFFHNVIFEVRLSDLPIYHHYSKRREMWSGTFGLFIETTTLTTRQYINIYCIYEVYSVYIYIYINKYV